MPFERQSIDPKKITPLLRHKWSPKVLEEGFIPFPKRLLRCAGGIFKGDHRLGQLRVVLAIVDYARPDVETRPTMRYLQFATGMTKARILECLDELEAAGLLTKLPTPMGLEIDYKPLVDKIVELTEED